MKNFISFFIITFIPFLAFAQSPEPAFDPMTAPGSIGISLSGHILFWENPLNVDYNEVYFSDDSALVANLNPAVRIYDGSPSTVYSSASLNVFGSLTWNTKYYWRIVEYNTSGSTSSPIWYFTSMASPVFLYQNNFDSDSEGWEIFGPYGFNNWYWSNTSVGGLNPGEMAFRWDPIFIGDSYLISPEFPAAANSYMAFGFNYYEDYWSDTVVVGLAYTTDDGNNWTSLWELHVTGNVGPETIGDDLYIPGNFRLGFYYKGNSNNIDFFFVDDVIISTPLTVSTPPSILQAQAATTELKVSLEWDPGSSPFPAPITGYQIQRKNGLPTANSPYVAIANVDSVSFFFDDQNVELNNSYTYRICTVSGTYLSSYGNETTAYVPEIVPVELVSFNASVSSNEVTLNWITATETNNSGFEIFRTVQNNNHNWETIVFVEGNGTTTKPSVYSFKDENVSAGNYKYRLKQIDYNGTFEYSKTIEAEISSPLTFSLEQNYPNPFNPSTKIEYSIPADGNVTLKIYDILGNEVSTLVDEFKQAGTFDVTFNGAKLSSGVYYYRLTSAEMTTTKKLMLTK
jgi:hypothetical protein